VIVISDTSVITNLAAIQQLDLLPQLYDLVLIPTAVYAELVDLDFAVPGTLEVQSAQWIEIRKVTNQAEVDRLRNVTRLDPGESEAIALVQELNADLLLIDERRGRAEANRLGLRITGLLGILVEAKSRRLVPQVKPLMDTLIASSEFRVSAALYKQILDIVNEGS
jgi:uncharacterized protein